MEILQENLKIKDDEIDGPQMLTWEQIVEMSKGGVDFGSHTVNYPNLTKISLAEVEEEVIISKKSIEDMLGKNICDFAYPFGLDQFYNDEIKKIITMCGFKYACTVVPGIVSCKNNPYGLNRIGMGLNNTLPFAIHKIYKKRIQ